jgi:DNA repair exonuclease SbcCD nuclease subunit
MSASAPRDSFTFLHAADVHLDSPLRGLERYEGAPAEAIRGATREALGNLVSAALEHEVDFVVLAGDLYDGDWPDYHTGLYFVGQVARLAERGIPVLLAHGNHDAESRLTRSLVLPANVHVFQARRPETRLLEHVAVAVHGQSFARPDVTEDLSRGYPPAVSGRFNVGVLHTALAGREGHAPYAPCTVEGLRARGYDYWALGHVHRREVVSDTPWIVFPGNLQGRHARETGAKGASLVEVEHGAVSAVDHVPMDVVRWFHETVDLSGCDDLDAVWPRVRAALEAAAGNADGRLAAVRLTLAGASAVDTALRARPDALTAQCRALAATVRGRLWVEELRVRTGPARDPVTILEREDALGGLLRRIHELDHDRVALGALAGEFEALRARLPEEVRAGEDGFDPTAPHALEEALEDVRALLVERLLADPLGR